MPITTDTRARVERSIQERIQALETQIEALKQRKVRKQLHRDPAQKQLHAAVRSIDKALAATSDHALRESLGEARNTLTACMALNGAAPRGTLEPKARRAVGAVTEDALLAHVRLHPGQRSEQISAAIGANSDAIRPVMKRLIQAGRVRTQGQKRATSYSVA
jgi:hypothetical protein